MARVPTSPHLDQDGVRYVVPRTMLPAGMVVFDPVPSVGSETYDVVLIDQPLLWSPKLRALGKTLVYRPTDEYPRGLKARLQRRALNASDAVLATSERVLDQLAVTRDVPQLVIENGVDLDNILATDDLPRERLCVYVGALDDRFSWRQVTEWATLFPDWEFQIAGPLSSSPPELPDNARTIGPVGYGELSGLLNRARIGLLPTSDHPLNIGRSPMKRYEYLAAGLTFVAGETTVVHDDPSAGVFTYQDSDIDGKTLRRAMDHPSPNTAGVELARRHAWPAKTDELETFLDGLRCAP